MYVHDLVCCLLQQFREEGVVVIYSQKSSLLCIVNIKLASFTTKLTQPADRWFVIILSSVSEIKIMCHVIYSDYGNVDLRSHSQTSI